MEIEQKKQSVCHNFKFNDESLNFSYKDKSGSDEFDVYYSDFPEKSSITIEQNEWLRNVGILWSLLGCYQIGTALNSGLPFSKTGFWLFIGLICIAWYALTKIKYSVFKTEAGNIFILNDKNHDKIISEMKTRKKAQLLQWYGDINLENELENEIGKFNWLAKNQVITQQEADKKIAQVEFAHKHETTQLN